MSRQMIAQLAAEHLAALDMVEKLNQGINNLQHNQNLEQVQSNLWEFSQFIEHIVQGHLPQEEQDLYPKMVADNSRIQSQVEDMLNDHRQLKQAHASLKEALLANNPSPQILIERGGEIARLLKQHLQREHAVLNQYKQ